jgi:hypothetical protein
MKEKDYCIDCGVEVFDGGNWGTAFHVVTGFSTNLLRINSKPQITCDRTMQ